MKGELAQEYGKVTAEKIGRFDEVNRIINYIWFPQFEIIKYKPSNGKTVSSKFVCISDKTTESGVVECKTEIEALQYAINFRDNIE